MRIEYKIYDININIELLERNGKFDNLEELKETYIEMFKIYEKVENTNDPLKMYHLNLSIEDLEFRMQRLWGFPQDRNRHRYWYECPKLDNYDNLGTEYRLWSFDCPIHGETTKNLLYREKKLRRILKNNE